jgi:carbonic anhydrase
MDARIDALPALGLELGSAHVIRNAGATVTDDVLRSLVISQRLLQTASVLVMAHTECGLGKLDDAAMARDLTEETGEAPPFAFGGFTNLEQHVRDQVERVRSCPWLPRRDDVRGYIFDVGDGSVRTVQ